MIIFRPFWRRLAVWSALLLCPLAGAEPAPAGRDAVQARYRAAQQLARTGDPAQALRELIWCFDEGMTAVASFRGVRLSFLIRDFAQLAKRYPPAEDFMRQRCGEAELRMLGGEADGTQEFAAWCDGLGEEDRLLEAFGRIPAGDTRRRLFGNRAFRLLLRDRRYPEALESLPFDAMVRLLDATVARPTTVPTAAEASRRFAIGNFLDYIEVVAGAKKPELAAQLREKLKAFDDSPATRDELGKRLARAATSTP